MKQDKQTLTVDGSTSLAPPKRWLEQASLRLGDWVYRGFVRLYRILTR